MKAALIMPTYFAPGSVIAGGERYAWGLATALSEKIETTLFTFGSENSEVRHGRLKIRYCKTLFLGGGITNPFSLAHLGELRKYDVVHCLQYKTLVTELAVWTGALFRRKVFVTDLAGGTYYCFSQFIPTWRWVREFLFISEFNRGLNPINVPSRIVYGGVDTGFFTEKPAGHSGRFLYVGRIFRLKGLHDLVQALPAGAGLDIVGQCHEPEYLNEIRGMSQGKDIRFYDSLSDKDVLEKYHNALAVVLPSHVDGGFTSAMEAMACGLPVLSTRLGSIPEVVQDGRTGFLVQAGDISALRDKLLFFMENPGKGEAMGREGRKIVEERFTWGKTAERCIEAYGA